MLSINPLHAFVADLVLVDSAFEYGGTGWPDQPEPAISFHNRKVDTLKSNELVAVSIESTVTISVSAGDDSEVPFSCKLTVGCTIAAPAPVDGGSIDQSLTENAVRTNEGFARTIIYQQTLASQLPTPLVIPPMSFDGVLD